MSAYKIHIHGHGTHDQAKAAAKEAIDDLKSQGHSISHATFHAGDEAEGESLLAGETKSES